MLFVVPCSYEQARVVIERLHTHHLPAQGAKFCLAAADEHGEVHGAAMVGRPVARMLDDGWTLEVTRLATDGSRNACSLLYGAAWRAARALGYRRMVTYTLESEQGASLRASGWRQVAVTSGGSWSCPSRPRIDRHPLEAKRRWMVGETCAVQLHWPVAESAQPELALS
jgi:hypothetical protein